jgi:HAD superfamily hydrolase (TIGR01509 family)
MRRFAVYLFDIDGTLLDSAPDIAQAILEVLADTPCRALDPSDLRQYVGTPLHEIFADLLPGLPEHECQRMIAAYRKIYPARQHRLTRVYPGVREALAALEGRKSTATTKQTWMARGVLEHFHLLDFFDHVQGTDGFAYKPAPDVVLASLAALGARPEDCLLVGDAPSDMEAGRRAGVSLCAVRYGYGQPADLARFAPDYWVDDLRELVTDLR